MYKYEKNIKVYEYLPGFVYLKSYISDDVVGMIGTINLDYRSLTHHFEKGVWIYGDKAIIDMKNDFEKCLEKSMLMNDKKVKNNIIRELLRAIIRIFSPLL